MRKHCLFVFLILPLSMMAGCTGYADLNKKLANDMFGRQLPDFTYLDQAGGSNAAGTMRQDPCKTPFAECWLLSDPDTWFDSSVTADKRTVLIGQIVKTTSSGSRRVNQTIKTGIDVKTMLPDIHKLLAAQANLDLSEAKSVDLEVKNIATKELNAIEMRNAYDRKQFQPRVMEVLKSRHYKIVQQDLRYEGFSLTVDCGVKGALSVALNAQAQAAKVIGKDAGLNLTVQRESDTKFKIDSDGSMVVSKGRQAFKYFALVVQIGGSKKTQY